MNLPAAHRQRIDLPSGLSILHANRLEDLRRLAIGWIRSHPLEPLENELFIVQSNGMAQWLKLALADNSGCGISAAVSFQFPARFLWRAYRLVLGKDHIPRESPYDKTRLIWRLLGLMPSLQTDPRFAPLSRFLSEDSEQRKRYQLACQLADLFDQYQVYRADWLEDWASGVDQLRDAQGTPMPLPPEQSWQPELWRRIQADVPLPQRDTSRSSLHRRFLKIAETLTSRPAGLPRRILVFGICSMPRQSLEAFHALSRHCQMLFFVHNPCRHYWADIIEDKDLLRIENARHARKPQMPSTDTSQELHQGVNPLLAAWGKQGRDYIGLLYGYDQPEAYRSRFREIDVFTDIIVDDSRNCLLHQVQQAILELQPLPEDTAAKQMVDANDTSITFQLAYSRQREVEILQDQMLSFFSDIEDLTPQDIIVMAPDIEVYAPHIEAVFGNLHPHDRRFIPFTIADKPERGGISLLTALEKLLHLPDSRMTVSDVMDLLETPAFRNRLGVTESDLPGLHRWIQDSGIRWGFSAAHRQEFDLPEALEQNTWRFGMDRMMLGYAAGAGASWKGIEPYDEVGGLEAARIGPLAVILEKLEECRQTLRKDAPASEWGHRIRRLLTDFFLMESSSEQLLQRCAEDVLAEWENACADAALCEPLSLAVVREAFLPVLKDSSKSQQFLAGMVNFCTLLPMRAIPFKVVCLLGMNDRDYPRSHPPFDFDLMSGCCRPGDRSRREDDRYLFLEALLSAREKLYISYIGRSIRDNSIRMPSVLAGQLRDYLAAGWRVQEDTSSRDAGAGQSLLEQLTCLHPLQPFSSAYFQSDPKYFTYAREWRRMLDAPKSMLQDNELPPPADWGRLNIAALIHFLKNPVVFFFNHRLNVYLDDDETITENLEPFALDRLSSHCFCPLLLNAALAAAPDKRSDAVEQAAARLRRSGQLPLKGIGEMAIDALTATVLSLLNFYQKLRDQWPSDAAPIEIIHEFKTPGYDTVLMEDWLNGLCISGAAENAYARWEFYYGNISSGGSISKPHALTGLWVRHLAGCAQNLNLSSYLIAPDSMVVFSPISAKDAAEQLEIIVAHWWIGLCRLLPVTAKTAFAYLKPPQSGNHSEAQLNQAEKAARSAYEGNGFSSDGELGYSRYLQRAFPDFAALWSAENNRFTDLAETLYAPVLRSITVTNT